MRNDLCNRCRQKVESRARKMIFQKLKSDINVINNSINFTNKNINLKNISIKQYNKILIKILPFLVCFMFGMF